MVDRIELVSQIFWFCLIFWGFYLVLLYGVLPYIALGLKMRRKRILKFSSELSVNSKTLFWSEKFCSFFGVEGVNMIDRTISVKCLESFLDNEKELFNEVLKVFNKGEKLVIGLNGIRFWGMEPRNNFYVNITERAKLYPWRS